MKTKFKILIFSILFVSMVLNVSCNEDKFLKEVPLDFYSPENSYITYDGYQAALTDLYSRVRDQNTIGVNADTEIDFLGTDIAFNARRDGSRLGDYNSKITPQSIVVSSQWNGWYKIISNANTIISRVPSSELNENQIKEVQAEAKLFRAWAYHHLVYLFGGVPLILEEVTAPKSDFTRATKEAILNQIILDATEAANNLPSPSKVKDGKLSNAVAYHLLAETYISIKDYDKAIVAATEVISNSGLALMTQRFGSLKNSPGDVYYDLFRVNNQNRGAGNTEGIWVAQLEMDVIGGVLTVDVTDNLLERCVVPAIWSLQDPAGKQGMYKAQAASTLNDGGRGVSFIQPTDYYLYNIWGLNPASDNRIVSNPDIRTSKYNIIRDLIYTDPASAYFGKSIIDFPSKNWLAQKWRWYPWPSKVTTPGQHPVGLIDDPIKMTLKSTAGPTYRDIYIIRLPETYFLRAEAYLLKGDKDKAADDLNVVRARAQATLVDPANVTLDFILDERARELTFEEYRRLTLCRMGKLVERVRLYNPLNANNINDYNDLFPIPYSEIESNKNAVLEQNPGYIN